MMPSLRLGLSAAAIYVAFIAAATFYVFQFGTAPADARETLARLLPFQFAAALMCVGFVVRFSGWAGVGFGRMNWQALIWLLPSWVVLGLMAWDIGKVLTLADLRTLGGGLALLIVTPFLIAFSEEVMFRGILLRGAMATLPLVYAMLVSAALFGVLHVVNGIAGQGAAQTAQQIAFAFLVGLYLAPIAVRLNNLWPLIIWHWCWNMVIFMSQVAGVMHPLALSGMLMQLLICVWLWSDLIRARRPH